MPLLISDIERVLSDWLQCFESSPGEKSRVKWIINERPMNFNQIAKTRMDRC